MLVALVGFAITAVLARAASEANGRSATSLLNLEAHQTASTLDAFVPGVQSRLSDALTVANATRSPSTFDRFVAAKFGGSGVASESLWARTVAGFHMVAHVGSLPLLIRGGEAARFFSIASPGATLQVTGILHGSPPRVGYAEIGAGSSRYAVYAESLLPASKRLKIPASSPFRQLNFAFYLGRTGPCRPARPRPSHREPTGRRVGHRHRGR